MRRRNPHAALRGFFAAQILFIPRKCGREGARPLVDHDFAAGRHLHDDFVERSPSDGNRRCGLDDRVVAHVSEEGTRHHAIDRHSPKCAFTGLHLAVTHMLDVDDWMPISVIESKT